MSKKNRIFVRFFYLSFILIFINSCGAKKESPDKEVETITPVTITKIVNEPFGKTITLNAVSSFLRKNVIKSSVTGVIQNVLVNLGDSVEKGQVMFTVKTKEAAAFDKEQDTMIFKGEVRIKAIRSGIISTLSHQKGDYVLEGDELAQLSEQNSLVFILSVPFEQTTFVHLQDNCRICLSDNFVLEGKIEKKLAIMDISSQTENYIIVPNTSQRLPENLIARILITEKPVKQAMILPKQAILANEAQTEFWVMKMISDSVAVKVPILKGLEDKDQVEIVSPRFLPTDRILLTGNYGLSDTAKVNIQEK